MKYRLLILFFGAILTGSVIAAGTLSEINYKKLQAIHKLIEQKQYEPAKKQITRFLSKKHDAYTQSLYLQTIAHIAIEQDDYPLAISYLEQIDQLKALPEFVQLNILYNLAQLYAQQNQWSKSVHVLDRWLKSNEKINAEQFIFAATVKARNKQYQQAITHIKQAFKLVNKPKEAWLQLMVSIYLEQKKYQQVIKTYQQLIKYYPHNKNYWKQLSGLYLQVNQTQQALAVLALAEKQKLLTTEEEILRLVNLYLYSQIPLEGAQLLEQKLQTQVVSGSLKNWKKLADAWILAQEYKKAINVLQKLTNIEPENGFYNFQAGQLLMQQGQWFKASEAFEKAINKQLKNKSQVHLYLGISAYYAKQPKKARKVLQKIKNSPKYGSIASSWLEQIN